MQLTKITTSWFSKKPANDDDRATVKSAWRRCTNWGAFALLLLSFSAILTVSVFSLLASELFPVAVFLLPFVYFCAWGTAASVVKFVYHLRRFLALSEPTSPSIK